MRALAGRPATDDRGRARATRTVALVAIAALGVAAAAAPAAAEPRYRLVDSTVVAGGTADSAWLFVTREQFARARYMSDEVLYVDGVPFGFLAQRSYLARRLPAGLRCVTGIPGQEFCLDLAPGRSYLLRLRELVSEQDVMAVTWLLDDAGSVPDLIFAVPLKLSVLTEKGRAFLAKRLAAQPPPRAPRNAADSARAAAAKPWPAASASLTTFDHVLCENSDEQAEARSDIVRREGRLTLDDAGLRWEAAGEKRIAPWSAIISVRYGGGRLNRPSPWIGVTLAGARGSEVLSFSDARDEFAMRSYNEIFAAIQSRWRPPTAEPVSPAAEPSPPTASPAPDTGP